MKNLIWITILSIGLNLNLTAQCEVTGFVGNGISACPPGSYQVVFEDNFDGNSINTNDWDMAFGWGLTPPGYHDELQIYIPNNVVVSNGTLKLIGKKENYVGSNGLTYSYTSGVIVSKKLFYYGKYEIRFRTIQGSGRWPAFWMFNGPVHNEMDFFDHWEGQTTMRGGMRKDYDGDDKLEDCGFKENNVTDFSNWHTLTIYFEYHKMRWELDNQHIQTLYRFSDSSGKNVGCGQGGWGSYYKLIAWPDVPMHLIANLAIRGSDFHPDLFPNVPFPSQFEIDYIRVSEKHECCSDLIIPDIQDYMEPENYNWKCGENLYLDYEQYMYNDQQIVLSASQSVEIRPGFTAELGSDFLAVIEDHGCEESKGKKEMASSEVILTNIITNLYPNPVSADLFIEQEQEATIKIMDMLGKIVFEERFPAGKNTIDVSLWAEGIYHLTVDNANGAESNSGHKFLIKRN